MDAKTTKKKPFPVLMRTVKQYIDLPCHSQINLACLLRWVAMVLCLIISMISILIQI